MEFEEVEGRGDPHKRNSAVKKDYGATLQRDIDIAENENAESNEDSDGVAALEDEETFCMLAEFEQGSSMEDKHQGGLCITSSGLDATRRRDVERVAAETMLELWLSIIRRKTKINLQRLVLLPTVLRHIVTGTIDRVAICCLAVVLAPARTTKIGDLVDLISTVVMALLTAKTQSTQNKNKLQESASERHKDADDEK